MRNSVENVKKIFTNKIDYLDKVVDNITIYYLKDKFIRDQNQFYFNKYIIREYLLIQSKEE